MKIKEKAKARVLRERGYSINEIHQKLKVSKSSISTWVHDIELDNVAKARIKGLAADALLKSNITHQRQTLEKLKVAHDYGKSVLINSPTAKGYKSILCALIYFCEGNKSPKDVAFSNSDPNLVKTFLHLFRCSFELNESKFRVCVHLHTYHDELKQREFWSELTQIPLSQFMKTYHKANSGKYKKEGYAGCVQIRYYDAKIARKLLALANIFMEAIRVST